VTNREIETMELPTKKILTAMIMLLLIGQFSMITPASADSTIPKESAEIGAFFANLLYTPLKIAYAVLGGFAGGSAYALTGGDEVAACRIWTPSIRGTYILTPSHLRGEKPIRFAGLPPQTEEALQKKLRKTDDLEQDETTQ